GLAEDMDLRVLLPKGAVSKDNSWDIPLKELASVAFPGGNLSLLPQGANVDKDSMEMFKDVFGEDFKSKMCDLLDGKCTCTFLGAHADGDKKLAEIGVKLKIDTKANLSDVLSEVISRIAEKAGGESPNVDIDVADLQLGFEGQGTLLWNLD